MRSAYSQAMSYAIQYNGSDFPNGDTSMKPTDNPNITLYGGPKYGGNITAVMIKGVYLHSNSANDWSGLANSLPFYNMLSKKKDYSVDKENHADAGNYDGYYNVYFYLYSNDLSGQLTGVYIDQQKRDAKGHTVK